MSAVRSTNAKREMQCKVCMDAGKSKSVYSSHWVKDNNGKVVCPTLLSVKCSRCSHMGHTVKFCTKKIDEKISKPEKPVVSENKTKNLKKTVDEFPVLNSSNITLRPHQKHFANEAPQPQLPYSDLLSRLRAAKAESEAANAAGIVEKPELCKGITYRGSANITLRPHQKHFKIEEGEEFDPFFGSEKKREIQIHNHSCFLGQDGLSWMDAIDSDTEEEEEEVEEEDYDW